MWFWLYNKLKKNKTRQFAFSFGSAKTQAAALYVKTPIASQAQVIDHALPLKLAWLCNWMNESGVEAATQHLQNQLYLYTLPQKHV